MKNGDSEMNKCDKGEGREKKRKRRKVLLQLRGRYQKKSESIYFEHV